METYGTKLDRFMGGRGIALFYFVLGFIFAFPSINIWIFLKDRTHLDPGKLALEMQLVDIPWLFKPLYAWISDRYPIFGYRRKSYVIIFSFLCSAMWFLMPIASMYVLAFYVVWLMENMFLCIADVVMDALLIERVRKMCDTSGTLQSTCSTSRSCGRCIGSLLGAFMFSEGASSNEILYVTAFAPLLVAVASFWTQDTKITSQDTLNDIEMDTMKRDSTHPKKDWKFYLGSMVHGFTTTDMWKFCLVATLYTMSPDPGAAYFYYYQDIMQVPTFQLQIVSFSEQIGSLVGFMLFSIKLRYAPPKVLMNTATLIATSLIMLHAMVIFLVPLPVAYKICFVYFYEFLTSMADILLFMPLYIMTSRLVTEGVEGTSYALVHSIQNMGSFMDSFLAAQIMNVLGISNGSMDHLWYMSFICAFMFLIPMTVLTLLPENPIVIVPTKFTDDNKEN